MKIFEKSIHVVEFTGCTMKVGDGFGDANYHAYVGKHTIEECLAKVKAKYPKANGMTVSNPCENKSDCEEKELFQLYDVISDCTESKDDTQKERAEPEKISCNGVEMIREFVDSKKYVNCIV